MATLEISEYNTSGRLGSAAPSGQEPALMDQRVTFTTSAQSASFQPQTTMVRLKADTKAHIVFGPDPVATASNKTLEAGVAEYFGVHPGQKVAAYDGSS